MKIPLFYFPIGRKIVTHVLLWAMVVTMLTPPVFAIDIDPVATAFSSVDSALEAEGIESNLDQVNLGNYTNFTGLYFEKRSDINDPTTVLGRITFSSSLDLSDTETQAFLENLGTKLNISDTGIIGLDLRGATEALELNGVGAEITFYGLDELGFGTGSTANEVEDKLLAYDDEGNLLDISTLLSGTGTYLGECEVDGGCFYYSIDVNHFTQYQIDNTAPVISETTPITTPGTDNTPDYTFTSDEAGLITYGGDCSSTTTGATVGANTITFNSLAIGTHNNCTITVTDAAANISNTLNVTAFEIQLAAPSFDYNYEIADGSSIDGTTDGSGNAYAVYIRSGNVYVTKNRNAESVIPDGSGDSAPSIAVESDGTIHVAFVRGTNIMYAKKQGSNDWVVETASAGNAPDIDVDTNGKVHIAGALDSDGGGYPDIIYVNNISGNFSSPLNVFNSDYRYYFYTPTIKVDNNGNYHLLSYHHSMDCGWSCYHTYGVYYKTNAYGGYSSNTGNNGSINNKSLALTPAGLAQIVYGFGGNVNSVTPYPAWNESAITAGASASIAISGSTSGIAYLSTGVKYRENNGSGWTTIANIDTDGSNPTTAIDGSNRFVYYEKNGKVYLATDKELFVSPVVSGVTEGGLYNSDRVISWDNGTGLLNGNAFTSGDTVSTSGNYVLVVTNSGGQSTTVNFTIDKVSPTITILPYSSDWTNTNLTISATTNEGTLNTDSYTFTENGSFDFVATDNAGNQTTETVTVTNIDKVNPTGSIASPTANALLKGTVSVTTSEVADGGSGINRVEFWYASIGTKIGEDTSSPYSINWNTAGVSEGEHSLFLKTYDNAGNSITSTGVSVIIDNTAPTNQNTVFTTSTSVPKSSEISVVSAEETGGAIWFAPAGTTNFSVSDSMTTAEGDSTTINAPLNEGTYKLFVIDAAGNVSAASTATLTTTEDTPPELVSANLIAVNQIEVNFDEDLDESALVIEDFKVEVGMNEISLSSLSEDNGKVTLTLGSNLLTFDTPIVTINPEGPRSIKDIFGNEQIEMSSVIAADKIPPTVLKIGNDSEDVTIAATTTETLIFSEAISPTGKLAVQKALTTGANYALTYAWNDDDNILTITGHATETTTFANDVIASLRDLAENSTTLLLIDSKLEATQSSPTGTGTTAATSNNTTPKIVITDPVLPVVVTITSGTTNPTVDVSSFISSTGSGILPQITINSASADVAIPDATTVNSADPDWDGVIAAPTITTVDLPSETGQTKTLSTAIEIGFTGAKLSFDKGIRILLPGQSGKKVGYTRTGTTFTEITSTCSADTQAVGDALGVDGDCKINVGSDLVIWTKHFTKFAAYTQITNSSSSSGGGGSVSSSITPYQLSNTISSTIANLINRSLDLSKIENVTSRGILMQNTNYGIILEIPQSTKITTSEGLYKGIISKPDRLSIRDTPVLPLDYQKIFGAEITTDTTIYFDKKVKLTLPVQMPEDALPENVKVFYYNETLKQYQLVGSGGTLSEDRTSIFVEIDHLTKFVVINTKTIEEKIEAVEAENMHPASSETREFTDTKDHWAYSYIKKLQDTGVVKGKQAGIFEPDTSTTRAELTKMVLLAFGYEVPEKIITSDFEDVDVNAWYAPYIVKAKELGLVEGYADKTFKPNQEINRAEALKIMLIASSLKIEGGEMDFSDTTKGAWYEKYVAYANMKTIIDGYSDGTFGPEKNVTRAEFAKMIVNTMDLK